MSELEPFQFDVDINVINHLGIGLYSSTPAALTELVSNSWDAEAATVRITVDEAKRTIIIEDDGHGMTADNVRNRFLKVGYSRRKGGGTSNHKSQTGKRYVMGRKGIGKLAMFALAKHVTIETQAEGHAIVALGVDVDDFQKVIEKHQRYQLLTPTATPLTSKSGTRITLSEVPTRLNTTVTHLRVRLARRFSVVDAGNDFKLELNGVPIIREDRGFYDHVQLLWAFDTGYADKIKAISPNLASVTNPSGVSHKCIASLPNSIDCDGQALNVEGYIASVLKPSNLGAADNSANMVSIFANGRVFTENVLDEVNSAKVYQSYLVGEVHANFLDRDDTDRATASREAIKRDDPRYQALLSFLRTSLETIGDQWDDWRIELADDPADGLNPGVAEWLGTLDKRDAKTAKKIVASIKNATIHADDTKNVEAKQILYRGAIVGFERLRVRKQLDRLDASIDVLGPEFAAIFATLDQVEEAAYADIVRQRLEVITKFNDIIGDPASLEKVAQEYLFEHLWLLDPSWDRVSGGAKMEENMTNYLKGIDPGNSGARLDITYRTTHGAHCIVELKRPVLTAKIDDLNAQVRKYANSASDYYASIYPTAPTPVIEIVIILGHKPSAMTQLDVEALRVWKAHVITYAEIIKKSKIAYEEYSQVKARLGPLDKILSKV